MFIIGILLLIGNTSFAQESQSTYSQCQAFVSSVFRNYNLPLPGTDGFPVLGDFNLENYDQEKPEFTILTTPIEIQKQQLYLRKLRFITPKDHLRFEGKILPDGSYTLVVSEIDPEVITREQNPYKQTVRSMLDKQTPFVHAFHFSKDCEFSSYHIRKHPRFYREGFFISTNSQCVFDEPEGVNEPEEEEGLAVHMLLSHAPLPQNNSIRNRPSNYVILKYQNYYRGLCALAQKTNI